ncbi:MAG TPA: hypothetical protein VND64_23640 [Pirellulales bacterium]|nr:hypothetical protein [Pirellulales bacterium]
MPTVTRHAFDPAPELAWEVWHRDTFDRECPPKCEVSGCGLVGGLLELWSRHLFEAVQTDGEKGFSAFQLWSENRRTSVEGPWEGAVRLRRWVFGNKERSEKGYVAEADTRLLEAVAIAHAVLHQAHQTSTPLLAAAIASADREDFEKRLADLTQNSG